MERPLQRAPIAVFGSSEPSAGEPLYQQARRLGHLLATSGRVVVTGGYGGVMEAASRGAHEAGGTTVGVLCDGFRERTPNTWLTERILTPDLHERTRRLVDLSCGYVVLHGKSGTLAELTLLWALHRAGHIERRPLVLLGTVWTSLLRHLVQWEMLEAAQLEITRVADDPEHVLDILDTFS